MAFKDRPSPRFTRLPVRSISQLMSLLARRENEIDFAKQQAFPFTKCQTTALFLITAIVYSSSSGFNQVFPYCHISRITFYISNIFSKKVRLSSLTKTKLVALLISTFQKLQDKLLFHDFIESCKKVMYVVWV